MAGVGCSDERDDCDDGDDCDDCDASVRQACGAARLSIASSNFVCAKRAAQDCDDCDDCGDWHSARQAWGAEATLC